MVKIIKNKNIAKKTFRIIGFKIPILLGILLSILIATIVYLAIEASVLGGKLAYLEEQRSVLIRENVEISDRLVGSSSLNKMQSMSSDLGYHKPSNILYLAKEDFVAKLP